MDPRFPRIPGHEVAGVIDEVGEGVKNFKKGDKVGVGWFGGYHCGDCQTCLDNVWVLCKQAKVCGVNYDGGYAEFMVAPQDSLVHIPDELDFKTAAPLLCAGVTTFNGIRQVGAKGGSVVVIQGVGGLGHYAIQFARHLGFKTVAVSNGSEKAELAKKLGAHIYIDASKQNQVEEIQKLGGARIIVATAPNAAAVESILPALGVGGELLLLAAFEESVKVSPFHLIMCNGKVSGWSSGDSRDSQNTVDFSAMNQIQSMIEVFPLEKAQDAFDKMLSNKARFRCVITMK